MSSGINNYFKLIQISKTKRFLSNFHNKIIMGLKEHYLEHKNKLYLEGAFSFSNLTLLNGIFLIGFALALGANNFQLGILLAIPLFANLMQLISAFILETTGTRKYTTLISFFIGRSAWIFAILMAFSIIKHSPILILTGVIILSSFFTSIGSLSLLSWTKQLVPIRYLGRFFGKKNIYANIGGMVAYLAGSYIIDKFKGLETYGYLFLFALLLGIVGLLTLKNIPEKKGKIKAISPKKFFKRLSLPFKDEKFRPLIYFGLFWGFALNIASPFFIVYMLEDLGLSFLLVSIFLIVDTLFRIHGLNVWRKVSDKFGARPILTITATIVALIPFWFIFISKTNYWLIPIIFAIGSIAYAGVQIALSQILFKSAPRKVDAYYLASFTSLTGLISALGPILGGFLAVTIKNYPQMIQWLPSLKWLFLISFILRVSCIPLIAKIIEPKAREVNDILNRMKTLRISSLFVNIYSITDYISKIVLVPEKQLFILQRKTINMVKKDITIMTNLLSSISMSLTNLTRKNINYYKNKIEGLNTNLKTQIEKTTPYLEDTKFKDIPEKVLSKTEALEKTFEESKTVITKKVKQIKKSVETSAEKLEKVYTKEVDKTDQGIGSS
jgi:MFS family permease